MGLVYLFLRLSVEILGRLCNNEIHNEAGGDRVSDISSRIHVLMGDKNLSYGELSRLTNIPKSALQRYATGETHKIPLDRLELIARSLCVSAAYLMGWIDDQGEPIGEPKLATDDLDDDFDHAMNRGWRMLYPQEKQAILALIDVQNKLKEKRPD